MVQEQEREVEGGRKVERGRLERGGRERVPEYTVCRRWASAASLI